MWQDLTVHIIVLLAILYTLYNGIKFFMPPKSRSNHSANCPGCSGGCSTHGSLDLSNLKRSGS